MPSRSFADQPGASTFAMSNSFCDAPSGFRIWPPGPAALRRPAGQAFDPPRVVGLPAAGQARWLG